jgi:hypothetical protein
MSPGHESRARRRALDLDVVIIEADAFGANSSIRGVGVKPPYAEKFPQPTLSTITNTTFGLA